MLANVQQATIKPIISATVGPTHEQLWVDMLGSKETRVSLSEVNGESPPTIAMRFLDPAILPARSHA